MRRTRLSTTILAVLTMVTATAFAGTIPVNYGTAELGEVRFACFTACFGTNCDAGGTVNSLTVATPFHVRGIRVGPASAGANLCNNTPGVTTPATLPRTINAGQAIVWDVDLVPTQVGSFNRPLAVNGDPTFDLSASVTSVPTCNPSGTSHCLAGDRFKTRTFWRTNQGTRGSAQVAAFPSDNSGLFYFFNPNNIEMLLKVLNGCGVNSRYWVFAAATTNVEFMLTVTDTQTQQVRAYFNPQGNPAPPLQDTSAFATCP